MNEDTLQVAERDPDERLHPFSRRQFLQGVRSGIIFFAVGEGTTAEAQGRGKKKRPDFNAYLRIGEDGRVTCFTGKIEMGQGAITSLAQTLADELDVSLESVDMVMGDTARCPFDAGTWGSMTTPYFGPVLRAAGAEARAVLIGVAAVRLKVPKDQLAVENGIIFDKTRKERKVTFAELTKGKRIERFLEQEPKVKGVGGIQPDRQTHQPDRRPAEGHGQSRVHGRHPLARHGVCKSIAAAIPRCQAQEPRHVSR